MTTTKCSNCGTICVAESGRCDKCGFIFDMDAFNASRNENNRQNSPSVEMKLCKYCQSNIPKKAKVCPVCRKQLGLMWYHWIIGIVVFMLMTGMLQELLGM